MGLTIIRKRDGSGVSVEEFKRKVKALKLLSAEICEDVEDMEEEFGGEYRERGHYRDDYRERGSYRDDYDRYGERRH